MRNLILLSMLALGLASCSKSSNSCYECTLAAAPSTCVADICDQNLVYTVDCNGFLPPVAATGISNEEIKNLMEQNGWTCTAK